MSAGLFFDFSFPLKLVEFLIELLLGRHHDPNTPQISQTTGPRQWFSQPRQGSDTTTEVLTIRYKLPLSASEITFSALRVPAHFEVWYQDRSNNWRQVLDDTRIPVGLDLSGSDVVSWYTFHTDIYPIVMKAIQIRAKRRQDDLLGTTPFVIGIKGILVRRNVYDRSQGTQAFEDEQDVLGNVIAKYIKDWDAPRAIDDNALTYWKCAPQPDPSAVVNCFLDVRDPLSGNPDQISRLFIDPVYTGNNLNVYYSSDDTVGTRKLSPITLPPVLDENTSWLLAHGRRDLTTGTGRARYSWSLALGPQIRQDVWFGIEWVPDFPAGAGPAANPILLKVTPTAPVAGIFTPSIYYDVGAGEIVLALVDGTTTHAYTAGLTASWTAGQPLRIVVGYRYANDSGITDTVSITVKNQLGETIASHVSHPTPLVPNISLDGTVGFDRFRGLMTAHIIKLEPYTGKVGPFTANPIVYVNPDPVIPDINGIIPSTTLDNAVFAADWTAQEHGIGGTHDTHYSDKEWTPIWKNYVTDRGTLIFPQTITAKYLKLELSSLSPEPYPIYDSGISVSYSVFPISVQQQSTVGPQIYSQPGGFLGLGDIISVNGVRSVNWLNPFSIMDAVQQVFGRTTTPVVIQTSPAIITDTIPQNTGITNASSTYGVELGNTYIYRRDALNPYILAKDQYYTTIKAEGLQAISAYTDVPWQVIEASNPGAIQHKSSPGALPIRGTDWWIFPGQTLKLPAAVMTQLTSGETVTNFHLDLAHRTRFTTTSVHRYLTRTLTRDKAIAYFAGFREIQPYVTTYITGQDVDQFEFTDYTSWAGTNTVQMPTGPISTAGSPYHVPNPQFVLGLDHWEKRSGNWVWAQHFGHSGGPVLGSAHLLADGSQALLVSEIIPVVASSDIILSTWVRWENLVSTSGGVIELDIIPVNGVTEGSRTGISGGVSTVSMPSGRLDGYDFLQLIGTYHVPASGVTGIRLVPRANHVTGDVYVDDFAMTPADGGLGTLFKSFSTTSAFNMVNCDFRDSGLVRSDPMWADIDPLDDTNIPNDLLAPYVQPIPATIPRGFWADSFADWADVDVAWGEPHAVVSVNIDGTLVYQGKRTLHFVRDAGVGEAGVLVRQWTHFLPNVQARVGAVFRKTIDNDNEVIVRLRRVSDGVVIYEETLLNTPVGYWYEYQSPFFDVPDSIDQVYNLELRLTGDDADDLYLSDLYTDIANIRYLVLLGDLSGDNGYLDVTDLRYSGKETYVSHTEPVTSLAVQVKILSPKAWALGATLIPNYLRT